MSDKAKILLVDDKQANLFATQKLLRQRLDIEVITAESGFDALALTLEHDFAMAIVDVQMPEMDGYELVELWRGNNSTSRLPVIFISAIFSDDYHHRKGYEAGAVDFLTKPFVPEILLSKVRIFLDLYSQRQQLEMLVHQLNKTNEELSRRTVQLEASRQVGQRATSILAIDQLLVEVAQLIQTRFEYYFVGILLFNDASGRLETRATAGGRLSGFSLSPEEESIISVVYRTRQPYLAGDVTTDPYYLPGQALPNTRSELGLPLQAGNIVFGVLDIQSDQPAAFSTSDIGMLQNLADQISIAIQNAQLYATIVNFNEELEAKVWERTAELQKTYEQLELLDRKKSDFINIVSHELRTPLTLIKGYGEMLLTDVILHGNKIQELQLQGIVNGAVRMHEIINSMLDMARIDNDSMELVFAHISLHDLLMVLQYHLSEATNERNLTIQLDPSLKNLPLIEADPEAINKLFNHLLLNAIKYTPDGGHITLSGQLLVESQDGQENPMVQVNVQDTGIGIDPEFHELIFTKFYQTGEVTMHSSGRTKFKGGGPGLGLAIAHGIVRAHRGHIWVESTGHDEETYPGSTFHILLPLKQPPHTPEVVQKFIENLAQFEP